MEVEVSGEAGSGVGSRIASGSTDHAATVGPDVASPVEQPRGPPPSLGASGPQHAAPTAPDAMRQDGNVRGGPELPLRQTGQVGGLTIHGTPDPSDWEYCAPPYHFPAYADSWVPDGTDPDRVGCTMCTKVTLCEHTWQSYVVAQPSEQVPARTIAHTRRRPRAPPITTPIAIPPDVPHPQIRPIYLTISHCHPSPHPLYTFLRDLAYRPSEQTGTGSGD